MSMPTGIVAGRRFAPVDGVGPFIAIYELDCDDLERHDLRHRLRNRCHHFMTE
jgi:hypothetical protein